MDCLGRHHWPPRVCSQQEMSQELGRGWDQACQSFGHMPVPSQLPRGGSVQGSAAQLLCPFTFPFLGFPAMRQGQLQQAAYLGAGSVIMSGVTVARDRGQRACLPSSCCVSDSRWDEPQVGQSPARVGSEHPCILPLLSPTLICSH